MKQLVDLENQESNPGAGSGGTGTGLGNGTTSVLPAGNLSMAQLANYIAAPTIVSVNIPVSPSALSDVYSSLNGSSSDGLLAFAGDGDGKGDGKGNKQGNNNNDAISYLPLITSMGEVGTQQLKLMAPTSDVANIFNFSKNSYSFLGIAAVGVSTVVDYSNYSQGNLSGERFSYHTIGNVIGIGVGLYFGAVPAAIIGGSFFLGEKSYDGLQYFRTQLSNGAVNFQDGLKNGWIPGR